MKKFIEPLQQMIRNLEALLRQLEQGRFRVFELESDGEVERTEESKAQVKKQIDVLEGMVEELKALG